MAQGEAGAAAEAALVRDRRKDAMKIEPLALADVKLVIPARHADVRGYLEETWAEERFRAAGLDVRFVQDNHSFSAAAGTVRGLHFQSPPHAQAKLVFVPAGAIFDVVVDLRRRSTAFGRTVSTLLSAANGHQLFVPKGFAHGFATLEPQTHVIYKVSAAYAPAHERGLYWRDPDLGIDWPVSESEAVLSDKDKALPRLAGLADHF